MTNQLFALIVFFFGLRPLDPGVTAAEPVQLVRMIDRTFYDSLRLKLKWGGLE